jgi:hypothetical protein
MLWMLRSRASGCLWSSETLYTASERKAAVSMSCMAVAQQQHVRPLDLSLVKSEHAWRGRQVGLATVGGDGRCCRHRDCCQCYPVPPEPVLLNHAQLTRQQCTLACIACTPPVVSRATAMQHKITC